MLKKSVFSFLVSTILLATSVSLSAFGDATPAVEKAVLTSSSAPALIFGMGKIDAVRAHIVANYGNYEPIEVAPGLAQIGFFFTQLTNTRVLESGESTGGLMFVIGYLVRKPGLASPESFFIWDTLFDSAQISSAWAKGIGYEYGVAKINYNFGNELAPKSFSVTSGDCTLLELGIGQANDEDTHAIVIPAEFAAHIVSPKGDLAKVSYTGKQYLRDFSPADDKIVTPECSPFNALFKQLGYFPAKVSLIGTSATGLLNLTLFERNGSAL